MVTNISTSEFTTTSSTRMASPCTLEAEPQFSITTRQSPLGFGKVFVYSTYIFKSLIRLPKGMTERIQAASLSASHQKPLSCSVRSSSSSPSSSSLSASHQRPRSCLVRTLPHCHQRPLELIALLKWHLYSWFEICIISWIIVTILIILGLAVWIIPYSPESLYF